MSAHTTDSKSPAMVGMQAPLAIQSEADDSPFSAKDWLSYFQHNKNLRPLVHLPDLIEMEEHIRAPLIRSLQKFQIGETGEGKHLKKFAKRIGDQDYIQCIDLFIREEQAHGQVLAEVIRSLDGTLITWHWSDLVFILLRRMLGLKTEIFILLIAEVVGKCFYKAVADKVQDERLREIFSLIVLDEIAHLSFHSQFLFTQLLSKTFIKKALVHYVWSLIFYTACFVFILDHRKTLNALGVTAAEFVERCSREFNRSAVAVFAEA